MEHYRAVKIKPKGTLAYQIEEILKFLKLHGYLVESFGFEVRIRGKKTDLGTFPLNISCADECIGMFAEDLLIDSNAKVARRPVTLQLFVED